jgi:predicted kinase
MGNHSRRLVLLVGESGSGKSTLARQLVENKGYVRINRDDLRIEHAHLARSMKGGVGYAYEDHIAKLEKTLAAEALAQDKNVVVDNTHLREATVEKWRNFTNHKAGFEIVRMSTDLATCIERDAQRTGKARVGRPVIERQFLVSKRLFVRVDKGIVICDVDGTVASHMDENGCGLRSPYGDNVEVDRPWQPVIDEVNRLYDEGYLVLFVSGRKSTTGDTTVSWLEKNGVKFHHCLMRHAWDNRSDVIVKQEILNELLQMVDKRDIACVIDDRVRVCRMWIENGLKVRPVYAGKFLTPEEFTTEHGPTCPNADPSVKGYRRCGYCLALEDF